MYDHYNTCKTQLIQLLLGSHMTNPHQFIHRAVSRFTHLLKDLVFDNLEFIIPPAVSGPIYLGQPGASTQPSQQKEKSHEQTYPCRQRNVPGLGNAKTKRAFVHAFILIILSRGP